jgi:ABC-type multidrug transport system fused ATPase/permease subunit
VVQQAVSQIRTVAAYNGEAEARSRYDALLDAPQKVGQRAGSGAAVFLATPAQASPLLPAPHRRGAPLVLPKQTTNKLAPARTPRSRPALANPPPLNPPQIGVRLGLLGGAALGGMQFVMFCSYAVALLYGANRIAAGAYDVSALIKGFVGRGQAWVPVLASGRVPPFYPRLGPQIPYLSSHPQGGVVLSVIIASLIGSFSLGLAGPLLQTFSKGAAAAGRLFSVMERAPAIDAGAPGLEPPRTEGTIELKGVSFAYVSVPRGGVVGAALAAAAPEPRSCAYGRAAWDHPPQCSHHQLPLLARHAPFTPDPARAPRCDGVPRLQPVHPRRQDRRACRQQRQRQGATAAGPCAGSVEAAGATRQSSC